MQNYQKKKYIYENKINWRTKNSVIVIWKNWIHFKKDTLIPVAYGKVMEHT